jgi:RNA polymerase sigma-70 factor (ECF subfamily)
MLSDAELVRQALANSQAAYHALVSRYATPAVNFAARIVQDRALAEDLVQEAFVRAFQRLETYDPQRRFVSWFFQIVHNVTIDYLRRTRPPSVSLDALEESGYQPAGGPGPDLQAEQVALGAALDASLARIRPEYREAILLRYREELSVQEIAEVMGVPVGTVKTYLSRARKELASILAAQGWAPGSAEDAETGHTKISYRKQGRFSG